jgi:hypothetical protein
MRKHHLFLLVSACLSTACLGVDESASAIEPASDDNANVLHVTQVGSHEITFIEDADGNSLIAETGPEAESPLLGDVARMPFAQFYAQLHPGLPIPAELENAGPQPTGARSPEQDELPPNVGLRTEAISTDDFQLLGGCRCGVPAVTLVRKECTGVSNNLDMSATSQFASYHVGHSMGDGVSLLAFVNGAKAAEVRVHTGEFGEFKSDFPTKKRTMRVQVRGAAGDSYAFGGCWGNSL